MSSLEVLPDFIAGKNALITGGLGFIGSNLARRLVSLSARVMLLDSLDPEYGGNRFNIEGIEADVRVEIGDARDERLMAALIKGQDFIFNLAGQVSHIDSMQDPYNDLEMNVRTQLSLLEACRKNPRAKLIFASTRQLYGKPRHLPVNEDHPPAPVDVNGINKLSAELYQMVYGRVYGLRGVSLRLTNTYGPRQLIKHSRQGFIGWFIRQVVEGKEIEIYGDGSQVRDFNHVEDVIEAMLRAAASERADNEVYNLGSDEPISLKALVEMMIEINGGGCYRLVPFPPEKRRIDIGSFYSDYSKIKRELGWRPSVGLREGLRDTINFYKENLAWYTK